MKYVLAFLILFFVVSCGDSSLVPQDAGFLPDINDASQMLDGAIDASPTPAPNDCLEASFMEQYDRDGVLTAITRTFIHEISSEQATRNWWMCRNDGYVDTFNTYCEGPNDAGVPYCIYQKHIANIQCQPVSAFLSLDGRYYVPCGSVSTYDTDDDGDFEDDTRAMADYVTDAP